MRSVTDVIVYRPRGEDCRGDKMPVFHSCANRVSWKLARKNGRDSRCGATSTRRQHDARRRSEWATKQRGRLALAKHDPTFGQVVGREFHADAVAGDDADESASASGRRRVPSRGGRLQSPRGIACWRGLGSPRPRLPTLLLSVFPYTTQSEFPVGECRRRPEDPAWPSRLENRHRETATILQS